MDPNQEKDNFEVIFDDNDDDSMSVDDFIRQLEAKEKDLHITLETTIIEIEQGFDDVNPSDFLRTPAPSQIINEPVDVRSIELVEEPQIENTEELVEMESKLEQLSDTIAKMREERQDIISSSHRRAKDFENYKARTERERNEVRNTQASALAAKMLPAIDNLNRALAAAALMTNEKSVEFDQFYQGIVMVNQQVSEIFEEMGITRIPAAGQVFDPHLHEAVATEESEDMPVNTIAEELLRGYQIGDRVIRHSFVKVYVRPAEPSETVIPEKPEETTIAFNEVSDDTDEDRDDAEFLKYETSLRGEENLPAIEPTLNLETESRDILDGDNLLD